MQAGTSCLQPSLQQWVLWAQTRQKTTFPRSLLSQDRPSASESRYHGDRLTDGTGCPQRGEKGVGDWGWLDPAWYWEEEGTGSKGSSSAWGLSALTLCVCVCASACAPVRAQEVAPGEKDCRKWPVVWGDLWASRQGLGDFEVGPLSPNYTVADQAARCREQSITVLAQLCL